MRMHPLSTRLMWRATYRRVPLRPRCPPRSYPARPRPVFQPSQQACPSRQAPPRVEVGRVDLSRVDSVLRACVCVCVRGYVRISLALDLLTGSLRTDSRTTTATFTTTITTTVPAATRPLLTALNHFLNPQPSPHCRRLTIEPSTLNPLHTVINYFPGPQPPTLSSPP